MRKQVKVILPENIEKLGKKWEIKGVKPGFYRNCSWLREKVWLYNPQNCQRMEKRKKQEKTAALLKEEKAQEVYQKINNLQLEFTLKKDNNNKVFGSIRAEDILNDLKQQGFQLEKKQLLDFAPLNNLGDDWLKIKLSENLTARVKIIINASE